MRRRYKKNPLNGPDQAVVLGGVLLGVLAVAGVVAYAATKPAAAAPPATNPPATNPPTIIHPPGVFPWAPVDITAAPGVVTGKTYRGSILLPQVGQNSAELHALDAFLQGFSYFTAVPSDWPDSADAADTHRLHFEGTAFASGVVPAAMVPTLKVWRKT